MKNLTWWLFAGLLMVAGFLQSCSTLEKRIAKAKVVAQQNPKEFAAFCAEAYPVTTKYIKGKDSIIEKTVTINGDSIPCPTVVNKEGRTVQNKVKCPDVKYKDRWLIRVDTVYLENTAKLSDLQQRFDKKNKEYQDQSKSLQEAKETASSRIYWIVGLALLSVMAIYMLIRTKR